VIVTHELGQAHRISDVLAFMYAGHIIEFGPTAQMFEKPREAATQEYLSGGLVTFPADDELAELVEGGAA
jgi:phosphate transport system ATP-binding protein